MKLRYGKTARACARTLRLRVASFKAQRGVLELGSLRVPVALGKGGLRALKREGDHATPFGAFALRRLFYRPDRLPRPRTGLPTVPLRVKDGWCDAVSDRNYNRRVPMPYPQSAERLWRQDRLYDLIVEVSYNETPRIKELGSAIFLHVARKTFGPTAGCVAMKKADLLKLLTHLDATSRIEMTPRQRPVQRGRRGLR